MRVTVTPSTGQNAIRNVMPASYRQPMSCVPVTDEMADLLEQLAAWPDVDTAELRARPEWKQARAWG
jgi:hypothetical protein